MIAAKRRLWCLRRPTLSIRRQRPSFVRLEHRVAKLSGGVDPVAEPNAVGLVVRS
jgi:hypothetical protein